jgi:crotonobetainyl-CoA:carnitine CoA-transferase CaiB-like acyl-CoA transferase
MDPADLRTQFPRLVISEITGFGVSGGPLADVTAFDSVIQAMSGLSGLIGSDAYGPPLLAPMSTIDLLTGIWAALGIAMALVQRTHTGEGTHVDTAMYDIGAALLERPLALYEFTGEIPTRAIDHYSPVGTFRATDGRWLSIVIPTDEMWRRSCEAMCRPDLAANAELDTTLKRAERMLDTILPAFERCAKSEALDADAVVAHLRAKGQPVGIVQTIEEVRHSEQLAHRRMFVPLRVRVGDGVVDSELRLVRAPLVFDGQVATPGPVPELRGR